MKLIVGLGNPGKEYNDTRHNVGFMAIDSLAINHNLVFKKKFDGLYAEINYKGEKIILLKPQRYMNLSGEVIAKYVDFYKIGIENVLIICDDLDMEVGKIRLRYKGTSGGHNGLKNIESHLHTQNYKRIKIGISNNKDIDTKDYVLGTFSKKDKEIIDKSINKIIGIFNDYLELSFDELMNKYN